jgi:DNA modification methylase
VRADAIEERAIDALVPYAKNARTHSDAQLAQLQASMREFGFTIPVLVSETGMIIAGHGRVMAAAAIGMTTVPVIVARGWSAAQVRAYVLADNRLAENAGWDNVLLVAELEALRLDGFDLGLAGFSDGDFDRLMRGTRGRDDEDDIPATPARAVTCPGDVWVLGAHRLVCGDSTQADTARLALAGVRPSLMVTDPPYGVEYDAGWRDEAAKYAASMGNRKDTAKGIVLNDSRADWREAWAHFPGDVAYVWHGALQASVVAASLTASNFEIRSQIVWGKTHLVVGRAHYHWQHEPCWYAVREGKSASWGGGRKQSTLWTVEHRKSETGHSTQKPVECMRRPMENHTSPGQAVYEPFSGSGTSIIAAESVGRACHAIELNPAYCDVAVMRWQQATQQRAVRESDGMTFAQAAKAAGVEVKHGQATNSDRTEAGTGHVAREPQEQAGTEAEANAHDATRASKRPRKSRMAAAGA